MGKQEIDGQMEVLANAGEAVLLPDEHPSHNLVFEEFLTEKDFPEHSLCRISCVVWNVWHGLMTVDQLELSGEDKCYLLLPVWHQKREINLWEMVAKISGLHDGFSVWMFAEIRNAQGLLRENVGLISEE